MWVWFYMFTVERWNFLEDFFVSFHLWKSSYLVLSAPYFIAHVQENFLAFCHYSFYYLWHIIRFTDFFSSHPTVKLSARYWYDLPTENEYWPSSHFTMLQWAAKHGWEIWFSFEVSNKYPEEPKFNSLFFKLLLFPT